MTGSVSPLQFDLTLYYVDKKVTDLLTEANFC